MRLLEGRDEVDKKSAKTSIGFQLASRQPHSQWIAWPQRNLCLRHRRRRPEILHPPALRNRRNRKHALHPGKRLADTLPAPATERKVSKLRSRGLCLSGKPLRIE